MGKKKQRVKEGKAENAAGDKGEIDEKRIEGRRSTATRPETDLAAGGT
jgi:hypothetical protein